MTSSKPRNNAINWKKIRAEYEKGELVQVLAKDFKTSVSTINNKASQQNWLRLPKIEPKAVAARATEIVAQDVAANMLKGKNLSRLEKFVDMSMVQTEEFMMDIGDSRGKMKESGELANPAVLRDLVTTYSTLIKTGREIHGLSGPNTQVNVQVNGFRSSDEPSIHVEAIDVGEPGPSE